LSASRRPGPTGSPPWVGNAAIAVAFAGYLGVFWGDVQTTNWLAALVAVGAIWLFTLVNILGARETGIAQVLTTVLKFVPLAVIGIVGLFYIKGGNYTPFTTAEGGFDWHINAAATLALWAFIGLESATVPAEEVKDPERTIPRATILGTLATTALYVVALIAIVGPSRRQPCQARRRRSPTRPTPSSAAPCSG
jgi:APA family basic amino acid/polyamine antiporter